MAKILALDTSSDACSVALWNDGELTEMLETTPRAHAKRCLPMIDRLLGDSSLRVGQLDALAFGRGPGSFTGLRIAAGIVQGLAFGADLPVVPVSTLEAMAFAWFKRQEGPVGQVVCLLDARMNEVYWAGYEHSTDGVKEIYAEQVGPPEMVDAIDSEQELAILGSGLIYLERLPAVLVESSQIQAPEWGPRAAAMAEMAAPMFAMGRIVSAIEAQPIYLRDEVAWKKLPGR
ncbi:tRNA (adenosine(37)-N6)-threonylcarbamoyltransferase complex dimerization subunit type 1 TsaB [Hahella aquimaris]|uniref:tRNA (adenosine(37)-N6)-threonylcarbamoyltransferase complex dimerization subunit type 1 TsaB n=1 Tax=Hahella sp. HNIBRBA332 TaxID=3015983 RepID=UPI00273C4D5F|nr:tRNA (adenosine(37)-N6)-threonylcarbamoyltransferase complex dimerization subunit type 1 TsaB [Hahella sp. HNIBRBA332]WLQ11500.1 tRNA (adenosine(37)-N6)-threonylcarbamoyltransferase complex dimerization subunit type 1 TsaB [Hahella sp. HNIBRBA332]